MRADFVQFGDHRALGGKVIVQRFLGGFMGSVLARKSDMSIRWAVEPRQCNIVALWTAFDFFCRSEATAQISNGLIQWSH